MEQTGRTEAGGRLRRTLEGIARGTVTAILDLTVTKSIAIFAWWLSSRANRIDFTGRAELRRRLRAAARQGRPVLLASNHLSMFDDPVLPMALYRTGIRALLELLVLAALLVVWGSPTEGLLPPAAPGLAALVWAAGISVLGARKVWWSLVDLVNFSSATGLRGKLEAGGGRSISGLRRALLSVANPVIYTFMRSGVVKTVFVDRRPGEEPKRSRARAVRETIEIAARGEPVWIFFEGGRAKIPGEISAARWGIGEIVLGLRARGLDPLVVAIRHRGLERVMPRGAGRWITSGHRIEVQWSECALDPGADAAARPLDAQSMAEAVRDQVAGLQLGKPDRAGGSGGGDGAGRSA